MITRPDSQTRYQGKPCSKCQATERYKNNGGCVACMKRRAEHFRKAKRYKGQTGTFQGDSCLNCQGTERYRNGEGCVACIKKSQMKRYFENRPKYAKYQLRTHLKSAYGLTMEQFEIMVKKQSGVCAICEKPCVVHGRLSVDHNHKTGNVRGLLCKSCNAGLGHFYDDPALFRKAADYLESYR